MKDIIIGIIIALVLVLLIGTGYVSHMNQNCRDSWDRMDAFRRCTDLPGCYFDADMWYEAKKSHSYYEAYCKAEDKK